MTPSYNDGGTRVRCRRRALTSRPRSAGCVAVFPGLERLAELGFPWSLGHHRGSECLPQDEHLREASASLPDTDNESSDGEYSKKPAEELES